MRPDDSKWRIAGGTLVIPGEMAARVDRLPMSFMAWEICLIVQVGWACAAATPPGPGSVRPTRRR